MVTIREAEQHDLADVRRLHRQAGVLQGQFDARLAPGAGDWARFRRALSRLSGGRCHPVFVAQGDSDDGLLGYVIGKVVDNRPFEVPEYGYVGCLHVDDEWRGRGIGARLFVALRDSFRVQEVPAAQVDVSPRNPAGWHFWKRYGFTRFLDHLYRETGLSVAENARSVAVVRRAEDGDLDDVLSLWREMMEYHAPLDSRLSVPAEASGYVLQAMRHWVGDDASCLLVAEVDDTTIGFALGGLVDTTLGLKPAAYGHIAHMCVTAGWRRRGVGRQLFARLREWFQTRGLCSIHIYVSRFSPVSQVFWRRLGFEDYIERLWCDL